MKFPTEEEFAKNVAEKALDEYGYKGKTLRQWIEIILATDNNVGTKLGTNLAEVGTDCISRKAAIDAVKSRKTAEQSSAGIMRNAVVDFCVDIIKKLPSAQPMRGKWERDGHHIKCDQCGEWMCDTDREGDRIPTEFCPSCGAKMER